MLKNLVQWQSSGKFGGVQLGKKRGLGSPQRLLVTFVRTKVTRGPGPGRPREKHWGSGVSPRR